MVLYVSSSARVFPLVSLNLPFLSLSELKIHIFDYIECFYNSRRPHSANNMLSPNEK
ncbi:IS3 family transposase [Tyzzerella sp. An114]|uniref:IS3 family transposase n=1 Tax=Tyzzerella sp. An114 TaxID=1965545 RepID=UPI003FCDB07E